MVFLLTLKLFTKRLKEKNLRLEKLVKKRTVEIKKQNIEILEKNQILFQQKEEIQAQAEALIITNHELEKLSIVASETDNAVLIFNKNYNLEWVNDSFTKIYGYFYDEFTKDTKRHLIKDSNMTEITNLLNDCISNQKSVTYEAENKTKTGDNIWVQTTLTPIFKNNELEKIIAQVFFMQIGYNKQFYL